MTASTPPHEADALAGLDLAVTAVRGAIKDAYRDGYKHGYDAGMAAGQRLAAWGYVTPAGIEAMKEKAESRGPKKAGA